MLRLISSALLMCCMFSYLPVGAQLQPGHHYQYKGQFDDDFRATTVSLNGHYYVVGNTRTGGQYGPWRILVCNLGENGSMLWSKTLHIPGLDSSSIIATDIQAGYADKILSKDSAISTDKDPDPPGPLVNPIADHNTFDYMYISGTVIKSDNSKSMIIIQVDKNANVIWARYDFNKNLPNVDEEGVSVETAPNGGAFLVGHTTYRNTNVSCVTIARFNDTGRMRWLNRYTDTDSTQTEGNFIPHQSCIFEEQVISSPTGIAVTGEYTGPAADRKRTFVMRVNHAGIENWRLLCPSDVVAGINDTLYDVGRDIVTDPNIVTAGGISYVPNLIVVGEIASDNSNTTYGYLFSTTITGAFNKGYQIFQKNSNLLRLWGTSIAHSVNNTDVVILGHSSVKFNGTQKKNFLAEIGPVSGKVNWSNMLTETEPRNTEHITRNWAAGYLIASTESGIRDDGISFRTDATGNINNSCRVEELTIDTLHTGEGITLGYERILDSTSEAVTVATSATSAESDSCVTVGSLIFQCNDCIGMPQFSICCCEENGKIKNKICLRFDTTTCMMRNWRINVWFGDSTSFDTISTATGNMICHIYDNPGGYMIGYQIQGEFFANGFWQHCKSTVENAFISVPYCNITTSYPPCSMITCPPSMKPGYSSIEEMQKDIPAFVVYPNPLENGEYIKVSFTMPEKGRSELVLTNVEGKTVWKDSREDISGIVLYNIPTQDLPGGIYFVKVTGSGKEFTEKVVIK